MPFTASDIIKIIFAIILPPLGVFLERGCNADFLINILLTVLGYIPVRSDANFATRMLGLTSL
ncbi:plasma membrane proteolipid Pmp3 [Kalmusia sp. IMI 367209]|nr:plasma membrane proteolipid Pmp3 [Kalmusia sp. IMI 367209]